MHKPANMPSGCGPTLTDTQIRALDAVLTGLEGSDVVILSGWPGVGKTTVMREIARRRGGAYLACADVLRAMTEGAPDKLDESLIGLIEAQGDAPVILIEDIEQISLIGWEFSERPMYLWRLFRDLFGRLAARGQKVVVSSMYELSYFGNARTTAVDLGPLTPAGYALIVEENFGAPVDIREMEGLHRGYRRLSGHLLAVAGRRLRESGVKTVEAPIIAEVVASHGAWGSYRLSASETASVEGLIGIESIMREITRAVILPMTEPALAAELGLKPKRGVLLHGPPGTGKTTIGRVIADRMKGKFYLLDGSFIPGGMGFNERVDNLISSAEANSPSVIFIDDADVIFRNGEMTGFARKLLSKLDGLESETQSQVCFVMTAMDVNDMPPALIRSGRVEVWLETALPDAPTRRAMIERYAEGLSVPSFDLESSDIVALTEDFTPADIKALVGDARGHLAYDRRRGLADKTAADYLVLAAGEIRQRKDALVRLAAA